MTTQNNAFDFNDITRQEVPVRIGDRQFTLKEPMCDDVVQWRNLQMATVRFVDGKPQGVGQIADVEPLLVSLCLFDKDDKNVPQEHIETWPSKIVSKLYKWLLEVAELQEPATKPEVKNASSGASDAASHTVSPAS